MPAEEPRGIGRPRPSRKWSTRGHIIDSLLLPKILDRILQMGGSFEIRECTIGPRRVDPSFARIAVKAASPAELGEILGDLVEHGATPAQPEDARIVVADLDDGRVPRRLLLDHEPADPGPGRRADGRP